MLVTATAPARLGELVEQLVGIGAGGVVNCAHDERGLAGAAAAGREQHERRDEVDEAHRLSVPRNGGGQTSVPAASASADQRKEAPPRGIPLS